MTDPVLIVASSPGSGEVVRRTLVESGRYEVVLSTNALEGMQHAKVFPFSIAILDVDLDKELPGTSFKNLERLLREKNPQIHIIALSRSNDPYDPDIKSLAPEGIITTPIYPSSILRTVDRVAEFIPGIFDVQAGLPESTNPSHSEKPGEGSVAWLQDVSRAAQHLTRLSLETAAQAALIVSEDRLWAYAGELPQPAAQELAQTVVHYWSRNGESDLARFVHLDSDGGEYLLYATALGSSMVLALVFGVETPFSKIRSQVVNLARLLATPPAAEHGIVTAEGDINRIPVGQSDKLVDTSEEFIDERPLFTDIPSPNPEVLSTQPVSTRDAEVEKLSGVFTSTSVQEAKLFDYDSWDLMSASPGVYNLTYGILLIPRLPDHHLVGDLADRLPLWVSQLCVAFAWRLEHISVRPDYLQWNASAVPETPPVHLVRNIRKHTSQRIFDEFPVLGRANPSGDFWATGFLLITGSQPPSGRLVQEFIQQTRQKQGITRPLSRQNR